METAALLRSCDAPSWAAREQQRIADWIDFLYAEPLAPMILSGPAGDAEVVTANAGRIGRKAELGARNVANAQQTGELPADRDPQMLAAGLLSGVHAIASVALARTPRPPAALVAEHVWAFLSGAVGLPPGEGQ